MLNSVPDIEQSEAGQSIVTNTAETVETTEVGKTEVGEGGEATSQHPSAGSILNETLSGIEHLTVAEFDKLYKEQGKEYWLGKNIVIDANLQSKPDTLNNEGNDRFRSTVPAAAVSSRMDKNSKFIGFFLTPATNDYLVEKSEIGEPVSIEFINISDIKVYDEHDFYMGYHINVNGGIGPNIIVSKPKPKLKPEQGKKFILDITPQIQREWNTCAPTTVSMILSAKGINVSQEVLADEMGTDTTFGTHNANAIQILNRHLFGYDVPGMN